MSPEGLSAGTCEMVSRWPQSATIRIVTGNPSSYVYVLMIVGQGVVCAHGENINEALWSLDSRLSTLVTGARFSSSILRAIGEAR